MKKLYILTALACLMVFTAMAVDQTDTIATATLTSLARGPIHLTSLEVINNGASTVQAWFYDAPTNVLNYAQGAYTNYTTYTTNIVITTTNYQGVVETATNLATFTAPNNVATNLGTYKLFKSFTVAAGGTVTWTPVGGVYLSRGLTCTNTVTNTVVNSTYSNTR